MATAVDAAIIEIDIALVAFAPQLEGLYDYRRLNVHEDTRQALEIIISQYEVRLGLLNAARASNLALQANGYATLPVPAVSQEVLDDLAANRDTIGVAFGLFKLEKAIVLGLTPGEKQPK